MRQHDASANVANTTTTLTSSNNPSFTSAPGNSMSLAATVASASTVSEGTVAFTDGGADHPRMRSGASERWSGHVPDQLRSEGRHPIRALYSGDSNFGTSNATLSQQVDAHTTVLGDSYCNSAGITLNNPDINNPAIDATPYPSHISVSGLAGDLTHLTVSLKTDLQRVPGHRRTACRARRSVVHSRWFRGTKFRRRAQ